MAKKGILIVAYGLGSFNASQAFSAFCKEAEKLFNPFGLRYAFTSELSRKILAERGKKSDSVKKAIEKMLFEKYTHIYVQSLHLVPGQEYENLLKVIDEILQKYPTTQNSAFKPQIKIAPALFQEERFFQKAVNSMVDNALLMHEDNEALLYMGHGTKNLGNQADSIYNKLHKSLQAKDSRIYLACMEGSHTLDDILPLFLERKYKKIHLLPFLTLIGKHANEDMAGDDSSSWKSRLEEKGFLCNAKCVALLQTEDFINFWLESLANLVSD